MAQQDRRERHLMRQRGAGSRALGTAFGFKFAATAKDTSAAEPVTPEKKKTPARPANSARRRTVTYRSHLAKTSPRATATPAATAKDSQSPKSQAKQFPATSERVVEPATDVDLPPPQPSPVRKAKFYEHLDDDVPPIESKPLRKPSTRARKRKTVTMPKRKKAPPRKTQDALPQPAAEPAETEADRAELVEAGLLDTTEVSSPNGSRKRKQAEALETQAQNTKKVKVQMPAAVEEKSQGFRSPSRTRLREMFKLHGSSKLNVSTPAEDPSSRPATAAPDADATAAGPSAPTDEPAIVTPQSPKKAASKVSKARKMFRIKDADGSGDESWFRPRRKK